MEYDENGNARIEPPQLPTELVIHYIVKDYQRMYNQTQQLVEENERLRASLKRINAHLFAKQHTIITFYNAVNHCLKQIRKHGIKPTSYIQNTIFPLMYANKPKSCRNKQNRKED